MQVPSAFVPVVFCATEVHTGEWHAYWGRDPRLADFIRDHRGDEFVAHNMVAEAKYLLQMGLTPPARWFDTMLAFRYVTNAEYVRPFGLLKAMLALGLAVPHSDGEKKLLQQWIGELGFDPDSPDDRVRIRDYCFDDCRAGVLLYHRLVGQVPRAWMAYAAEFCLATARMELRGIPLDVSNCARLQEHKGEVLARVQAKANRTCPVFCGGKLDEGRLLAWCARHGIGWPSRRSPRTGRKYTPFDDEAFKRIADRHPFLAAVREANKTTKQLSGRDLAVDFGKGRHYFGNIPCAQKTGRTSFTGFLFGAPKWMRWLVAPSSPEHRLLSVDFEAEEILIAAHLSGDGAMARGYATGDPHMAFAVCAGAAPPGASKDVPPYDKVRKRYKAVNLGVNYGQSAHGIAESTGMFYQEARALLAQHHRAYPQFWGWTDRYTMEAFARGRCWTKAGWPRKVTRKDNPRSVANFVIQGTGADLMRLAVIYLTRQKAPLLASIHDGFLFECHRDDLPRLCQAVDAALGQAVEQLLPGGAMRWTKDVFEGRYKDKDGEPLWRLVESVLVGC
jgi:DNA polymerase I-like protein with 3'-5' exonuclease and polymerase domains